MTEQDNYWRRLFTEYKKSGLKRLEFCRENDISHSQFRYQWNKQNQTARRALKLTHPHPTESLFEPVVVTKLMEPTSGHLFLFRSRRGNKLKALYYEEHSFTLWYRRLDKGKFIFPRNIQGPLELTPEHFNWLLASNKFVNYQGDDPPIYRDFY